MAELERIITDLRGRLERCQKEVENQASSMQQLQACLKEQLKAVIHGDLEQLLGRVREKVVRITERNIIDLSAVVLISPEGRVTVEDVYGDPNADFRLKRLKSQGFSVTTLTGFSSLIQSLEGNAVVGKNWIPIMEFLRANTQPPPPPEYWLQSTAPKIPEPSQAPASSKWKLSDFLPAKFPNPPLPRGLFRD